MAQLAQQHEGSTRLPGKGIKRTGSEEKTVGDWSSLVAND